MILFFRYNFVYLWCFIASCLVVHSACESKAFVCITGQLSRLELTNKISNILTPLSKFYNGQVDIALVLDVGGSYFTNVGASSDADAKLAFSSAEKAVQMLHQNGFKQSRYIKFSPDSHPVINPAYLAQLGGLRIQKQLINGLISSKDQLGVAEGHARMFASYEYCLRALQRHANVANGSEQVNTLGDEKSVSEKLGEYSIVVRLREDSVFAKPVHISYLARMVEKSKGIITSDCAHFRGINDKGALVHPSIAEAFFSSPIKHFLEPLVNATEVVNTETYLNYVYHRKLQFPILSSRAFGPVARHKFTSNPKGCTRARTVCESVTAQALRNPCGPEGGNDAYVNDRLFLGYRVSYEEHSATLASIRAQSRVDISEQNALVQTRMRHMNIKKKKTMRVTQSDIRSFGNDVSESSRVSETTEADTFDASDVPITHPGEEKDDRSIIYVLSAKGHPADGVLSLVSPADSFTNLVKAWTTVCGSDAFIFKSCVGMSDKRRGYSISYAMIKCLDLAVQDGVGVALFVEDDVRLLDSYLCHAEYRKLLWESAPADSQLLSLGPMPIEPNAVKKTSGLSKHSNASVPINYFPMKRFWPMAHWTSNYPGLAIFNSSLNKLRATFIKGISLGLKTLQPHIFSQMFSFMDGNGTSYDLIPEHLFHVGLSGGALRWEQFKRLQGQSRSNGAKFFKKASDLKGKANFASGAGAGEGGAKWSFKAMSKRQNGAVMK